MTTVFSKRVAEKLVGYPDHVKARLSTLRNLILEVASELEDVGEVEETLKWDQLSYIAKSGSTIRIDRDASNPGRYAMYFHCRTRLIDTFREIHGDKLQFEGNRAIIFDEGRDPPIEELKQCIALALRYHRVKHLPLLGA